MAFSLAVTSSSACCQLMRWYLPLTSFIGVLSRWSPWPCSRTEAPLAQCEPMLSGESKTGSCRTHTPFSTTASSAQPTEQWVQTVRRTSTFFVPDSCACAAWAGRMERKVMVLAAAPAPRPMPERLRNERRFIVAESADSTPRATLSTSPAGRTVLARADEFFLVNSILISVSPWGRRRRKRRCLRSVSDLGGVVVLAHVIGHVIAAARHRLRILRRGGFDGRLRVAADGQGRRADSGRGPRPEEEAAAPRPDRSGLRRGAVRRARILVLAWVHQSVLLC